MKRFQMLVMAVVVSMIMAAAAFAQWQPPGAASGSIYYNGGNVGVGVTAPAQRLTVAGNVAIGDVGSSPETVTNGVDWTSSDGDHLGSGWSTQSLPSGSGMTFTAQVFTGLGFTGRAQRVTYTTAPAGSQGKLTQTTLSFVTGKTYRISLSYRSSTTLAVVLNDSDLVVYLPPNSGNPIPVSVMYTALYDRNMLDFYAPGGGQTPTPGMWFEVDDVSVKQVTAGNLSTFGLLTGGGTSGIKLLGNGWTGIGTTSPAAPLQVNGAVTQSQLYVTNTNITNTAQNSGVLSALAYAADNVSLGFDVDWNSATWRARTPTIAWLGKYNGHFLLQGSGNNVVNSALGPANFKTYQDVDLTTGATEFRPADPSTAARITGGTINLMGYPTVLQLGNGQFIKDNAHGNMRIFAGEDLAVDTSVGGIVMTPANQQFLVNGTVVAGATGGNTATNRLTVNGSVSVTGTITAASVIGAVYQDLAEWVPATTDMAPGTVVVLNPAKSNEVMPSSRSYDTSVAGVVSARPGILLGVGGETKEQVATTGRVKVRVDATRAPIRVGDLLVTSDTSGMAMRSEPIDFGGIAIHRPGSIVGKALEPLENGTGEILVLLSLQ